MTRISEGKVIDQFFLVPESNMRFRLLIGIALSYALVLCSFIAYAKHRGSIIGVFQKGSALEAHLAPNITSATGHPKAPRMSEMQPWAEEIIGLCQELILSVGRIALFGPCIVAVLSFLAWLLYRIHPCTMRTVLNLKEEKNPAVEREMESLAKEYGVPCPAIVRRRSFGNEGGKDAMVFGTPAGYSVWLIGDWSSVGGTGRAILVHELAHIRNRDCALLYGSLAVFAVFALGVAAAAISLAALLGPEHAAGQPALLSTAAGIRLLLVTVAMFLITVGVIRRREFLADWRAGRRGTRKLLLDLLGGPGRSWWKRIVSSHPDDVERTNMLQNPDLLNETSHGTFLITGIMWGIVTPAAGIFWLFCLLFGMAVSEELFWKLIQTAEPGSSTIPYFLLRALAMALVMLSTLLPLGILGAVLEETLGMQARRQTLAELAGRCVKPRLLSLAFVTAVGCEIGFRLSLVSASSLEPLQLVPAVAWILAATVAIWLWLLWLRELTRLVYGGAAEHPLTRSRRWLSAILSTFIAVMVLLPVLYWRLTLGIGDLWRGTSPSNTVILFLTTAPVLFVVAASGFIIASLMLLIGAVWSQSRVRKCPFCGQATEKGLLLHRRCAACQAQLTPWLYAD